jgi:HEAT repeat protein
MFPSFPPDAEPIELLIQFLGYSMPKLPQEESELWLQELAVAIAQVGREGTDCLLAFAPYADELRLRAILLAMTCVSEELSDQQREYLCDLARHLLADKRPMVVAEAIDTLTKLGCRRAKKSIATQSRHSSPYVRGSVLRYFARQHPKEAVPRLERALNSKAPVVRQNAVDELDEMNYRPALAKIKRLLADPDKDVRQAARTAVEHLENGVH